MALDCSDAVVCSNGGIAKRIASGTLGFGTLSPPGMPSRALEAARKKESLPRNISDKGNEHWSGCASCQRHTGNGRGLTCRQRHRPTWIYYFASHLLQDRLKMHPCTPGLHLQLYRPPLLLLVSSLRTSGRIVVQMLPTHVGHTASRVLGALRVFQVPMARDEQLVHRYT